MYREKCSNNMKSRRPPPIRVEQTRWQDHPHNKHTDDTHKYRNKRLPQQQQQHLHKHNEQARTRWHKTHKKKKDTSYRRGVCRYRSRKANGPVCYIKAIKLTPPIVVTEPDSCNAELIELIARLSSRLPGDISNESFFFKRDAKFTLAVE